MFVYNYSKKNNTSYTIKINNILSLFYVHNEYKNQLNGYSKTFFDPFCRKKKITYHYKDKNNENKIVFRSSIGQLNFFQWAIRNRIIIYVQNHIDDIEKDMKKTTKENKIKKSLLEKENKKSDGSLKTNSIESHSEPDAIICSSESINSFCISPKQKSNSKTDSDVKNRRQQLSRSVYENGITKSNKTIRLEFD